MWNQSKFHGKESMLYPISNKQLQSFFPVGMFVLSQNTYQILWLSRRRKIYNVYLVIFLADLGYSMRIMPMTWLFIIWLMTLPWYLPLCYQLCRIKGICFPSGRIASIFAISVRKKTSFCKAEIMWIHELRQLGINAHICYTGTLCYDCYDYG